MAASGPIDSSQHGVGQWEPSLRDKSRFLEIARGSVLGCDAIHKIPISFEAIDPVLNRVGKPKLEPIVSMLTRLGHRTDSASEGSIEYEYRAAE